VGKRVLQYLSPTELITIRLLLGVPVLAIVMKIKGLRFHFDRKDYPILIIASLILGAHWIIQTVGLHLTTATNTAWLIATIPAFVAVLSWLFLKEKLTFVKIFGIFLGTAGVILLVSRGDLKSLDWIYSIGDWLVLFTCITWSVYSALSPAGDYCGAHATSDPQSDGFDISLIAVVEILRSSD
jgi:drug/metabolite transporter (DMT)-like permease